MSERPSDGMELDDLRDEFDWMFEFQSRMAERISGDTDVHNLVDYVGKLESENAELRELARTLYMCSHVRCDQCEYEHENTCDFDAEEELRELGVEV